MLFATKSQNRQASEQSGRACSSCPRKNLRISVTTQQADRDTAGRNGLRAALLLKTQSLRKELQVERFQSEPMMQSTVRVLTMKCAKTFLMPQRMDGTKEVMAS